MTALFLSFWVLVASNAELQLYLDPTSVTMDNNAIAVIGELRNSRTQQVEPYGWSVNIYECSQRIITLHQLDVRENTLSSADYLVNGSSFGSTVVRELCSLVE